MEIVVEAVEVNFLTYITFDNMKWLGFEATDLSHATN